MVKKDETTMDHLDKQSRLEQLRFSTRQRSLDESYSLHLAGCEPADPGDPGREKSRGENPKPSCLATYGVFSG
jgi:hypothetical protein